MVMCLELEGYAVDAVASTREAIERLRAQAYPIVISDIYLDERTGIDVLRTARQQNPDCAVILMTGRGSMETVMAATEGGAFEYLAKPFEMAHMIETIKRAEKSLNGVEEQDEAEAIDDLPDTEMIGSSPRMIEIYKTLSQSGAHRCDGADRRRDGHRQGTDRAHDSSQQQARAAAVRAGGLRSDCSIAARKRIVRDAEGRLHRGGSRSHGRVRSGGEWDRVFGRNRRYRSGFPVKAAAFSAGARDSSAGIARGRRKWTCG